MFDYDSSFIENKMKIQIFITFMFCYGFSLQQSAHVLDFYSTSKYICQKKEVQTEMDFFLPFFMLQY